MGRLSPETLTEICTSPEIQAELMRLAEDIAGRATQMAMDVIDDHRSELPEYGTVHGESTKRSHEPDPTIGSDRARAHVWAKNGAALHAEDKVAPLLQIVASDGAGGAGR